MELSQIKAKREISLHHCFRGRFKTRFFLQTFPFISPESWNGKLLQLPYIITTCLVCERVRKKERQIFNHELHKRKVEQSRLCMLFQVSKLNEHLSIINHSQNHMQIHFTKMREREKRSVFDFHPRENSRMLHQNLLNYSPFTSYNYYDISQDSTLSALQYTFSSFAWGLLTEKTNFIN